MFGSKAKELETALVSTKLELENIKEEKKKLEKDLESTRSELEQVKTMIGNSGVQSLEKKAKETIAEYEGLKSMYSAKIREFEAKKDQEEQRFAREAALKRHHLEDEIADTKQASQQFITSTVDTFGETYHYYLNQIKVLMDALGQVAEKTGQTLFDNDTDNLKANFSQKLAEALKSGTDTLTSEDGDLIVIGASEEDVDMLEVRSMEPDEETAAAETEQKAETISKEDEEIIEKDEKNAAETAAEVSREIAEDLGGNNGQ